MRFDRQKKILIYELTVQQKQNMIYMMFVLQHN